MPYASAFSQKTKNKPPTNQDRVPRALKYPITRVDWRGLDITSPYDAIKGNRATFGHDFRIYAEESDSRNVSVSSRKGSGPYIPALSSAVDQQNTTTTGAADKPVGLLTEWKAMKFTAGVTGPLVKVGLNLKKTTSSAGPIVIKIYTNSSGKPGTLIAESGILNSAITTSYAYVNAHFIEAPTVTSGQVYWIVAYIQDDGASTYSWSSNTTTTLALTSNSTGTSWSSTIYSLNFKTYVCSTALIKGGVRFAPTTSVNKTVIPIGTTLYSADDVTGALTAILTGQSSSATQYYFAYADNKLFWVNGFNDLTTWDGSSITSNSNLATNGTFEANVTGWTGGTGTTVTRDTGAGNFRTGVAGMKLVGSGGNHAVATFPMTYEKGKQYTLTMYVKGTASQTVTPRAQGVLGPAVTLTGGWDLLTYTFIATSGGAATYGVESGTNNATIYVDDVDLRWTGIQTITHSQLPILSNLLFHKNLLIGQSAADPNKLIWSEAPGNDDGAGAFWYNAYLSTSFIYVPTSKASDPITALASFQDNLYIFSRSGKWTLYGSDPGSFTLRQATGKKGCVGQNALFVDENNMYFAAPDGLYRFNGSKDDIISTLVQSEFASIANINNICTTKWKRQIRFYYSASGSPVNNSCLLWHTVFEEMTKDTDTFVSYAIPFTDGDDADQLVELSSVAPRATYAEVDYNNHGKAIDFIYYCKNDSMGIPAMRKRLTRFFPLLEGDGGNYPVQVGVDKDMEDETRYVNYSLKQGAALIGQFAVGDGTLIEKNIQFKPTRFRISGYAYYWQVRVKRRAINNRVRFIGYVLAIRTKRL